MNETGREKPVKYSKWLMMEMVVVEGRVVPLIWITSSQLSEPRYTARLLPLARLGIPGS
jgi:hypothetical protein